MKTNSSSINHGIINLKSIEPIGKPEFKRRDMMIWYIETRLEELNNVSMGASKDVLEKAEIEYKRLKSGIHFLLNKAYEQTFTNSQSMFEHIQATISQDIMTIKTTLINHIHNNHLPQSIDIQRFKHILAIQKDWQKYMNLIKDVIE